MDGTTTACTRTTAISLRTFKDVKQEAVPLMTTLGDDMTDVMTRADDRCARLTLLLRSLREEERHQLTKPNRVASTAEIPMCVHLGSKRQKGANQCARWAKLH